jgi:predicted phosphodiesterase
MPAGKQKLSELMLYALSHGEKATMDQYRLPEETWNRYKREYRKHFGDGIDALVKLKDQFSDEEIRMLSTGSRPNPHSTVSHSFSGTSLRLGIMSDNHLGSVYSDPKLTEEAIREFNKQKVDMILHPGDIVEGMMGRPGDVYELTHIGFKAQRDLAIEILKPAEAPLYIISGNHCRSFNSKHGTGANIVEDICSAIPSATFIGDDEGDIEIAGIRIRLFHGGDGSSYAISYRGQKLIEAINGGSKPALMIAGHTHKSLYMPAYRNVHYIEAGTLQWQSAWMRGKKLMAHVGFWIVDLVIGSGEIKSLNAKWYPFYQ